jgi:hypothetical protein
MAGKRVTVVADPYGVIEIRKERVTLDLLNAAEGDFQAFDEIMADDGDGVTQLGRLLDDLERDIVAFWEREGLPGAPGRFFRVDGGPWTGEKPSREAWRDAGGGACCQHPAEMAEPGSWVGLSWGLWRCLQATREALAKGEPRHAAWSAFLLGQRVAEIRLARRHGHDARDGRGRKAARSAGGRAPKRDHDLWEDILKADAGLRRRHPSWTRNRRAEDLAKRFGRAASTIRKRLPT